MPKKLHQKNTFWLIATGVLTCIGFILIIIAITLSILFKHIEGLYIAGFVSLVVFGIAFLFFDGILLFKNRQKQDAKADTKAQFTALSDSSESDASVEDEFSQS